MPSSLNAVAKNKGQAGKGRMPILLQSLERMSAPPSRGSTMDKIHKFGSSRAEMELGGRDGCQKSGNGSSAYDGGRSHAYGRAEKQCSNRIMATMLMAQLQGRDMGLSPH